MYHIKEDQRCKTSVSLIYNALVDLLKEKNFDDITITDIHTKSTVGRATFYRNFDKLIDVLIMKSDLEFEKMTNSYIEIFKENNNTVIDPYHFLNFFLKYWRDNIEIIEILLKVNRIDIIYNSFKTKSIPLIDELLPNENMSKDNYSYFISIRAGIAISLLITWIEEGRVKSTDELLNIIIYNINLISKLDYLL